MLNAHYKEMLCALSGEEAEFIVVGAHALASHGFPRATGDLDIWVNPTLENSRRVYAALARFGAPLQEISADTFATPGIVLQIGVAPCRVDIITAIDGVFFGGAEGNKVLVEIDGLHVPVLSIADLLKNKESTGRDKDVLDAKTLREHMRT